MSVPCTIGKDGVIQTVRQKLSEQEKMGIQFCADSIRAAIRECGIFKEKNTEAVEVEQ